MVQKYYLDTCIWRDFYEERISRKGKPLGEYASKFFSIILKNKYLLLYSDLIIKELKTEYNEKDINEMFNIMFISGILNKVEINNEDYIKAKRIGNERKLPTADVLHAIIARKNNVILISQDQHMQKLKDIVEVKKPEELI